MVFQGHEFSGVSMDVEGQPSLHALPQVATVQSSEGTGPNIFPLSMQAQASAGDDGQPYFLDIFCGTAGVTAALMPKPLELTMLSTSVG